MIHFIDLSLADKAPAFIETLSAVAPDKAFYGRFRDPEPTTADRRIGVVDIRTFFYRRTYRDIEPFLRERLSQAGASCSLDALILDFSTEGEVFNERLGLCLHDLAGQADSGIPRLFLAQQNQNFSRDYERWCQASGRTPGIQFIHWHSWLVRSLLTLDQGIGRTPESHLRQLTTDESRPHHFLNLNNTLRPHRLLCLLGLHNHRLLDKGLVSFPAIESTGRVNLGAMLHQFRSEFPGAITLLDSVLPELENRLPMVVDETPGHPWTRALDFDPANYRRSWFSLVTESDFSGGGMRRFTEKLLKPIVNLHPFVVFGNPGTLALLRDWGFETFSAYFDESYDLETCKEARMEAVMRTMSILCDQTLSRWRDLHRDMQPLLEANFHHLMGLADRFRSDLAPAVIAEVENHLNAGS